MDNQHDRPIMPRQEFQAALERVFRSAAPPPAMRPLLGHLRRMRRALRLIVERVGRLERSMAELDTWEDDDEDE